MAGDIEYTTYALLLFCYRIPVQHSIFEKLWYICWTRTNGHV